MIEALKRTQDNLDKCFIYKFGATYQELEELRAIKTFYRSNNVRTMFNLDYTDRLLLYGIASLPQSAIVGVA